MNIFKIATTIFIMIMFLHFCAVINCFIGMAEHGWILKDGDNDPLDAPWDIYVT